jgi:uncharacterized OB-fold protein
MPHTKPLPEIDETNRPFWDALKERRFLVPRCESCGHFNWPPYPACRSCLGEAQEWTEVSGNGTLFSFTVVHRGLGAFSEDVPYVIALVELDERPRSLVVMGNVDHEGIDLEVGMPMEVSYFDVLDEDVTLWRFVPSDRAQGGD